MDRIKRPFISLPYRKRRDAFIRWRWRILLDTPIYGGQFTSQLQLDEQDEGSDWFDFLFVGSDGQTVWNAFIITARAAFLDADSCDLPIKTEIRECFKIDRSFPKEVGLDIVVDEPFIDRSVIETAISDFRGLGEVEWINPVPVPQERLLAGNGVQHG
ncbi:hypothetical protein ACRS7F_24505 [Brucella anthropi]|uniref:hypothetical protein n=1 Tax=Brucella anthropi TaxID=529 RepID=UPI00124DC580|nr:hypothetical protein [Brucella anthropi]KAB2785438.1 hypothetical protein F9K96_23540 [Brucella anthropi]QOD66997.1 hypothetical protein HGK82_23970 [Ochrobactrum sp. MT180101]